MLFKVATIFDEAALMSENGVASKYMMTTFIICFEGKTSTLGACIRGVGPCMGEGKGFLGEMTFVIFQFCLEVLRSFKF